MIPLLFEQPWLIGTIGTVLTVLTFYGWIQTGNSIAFKTGVGFAIVSILLVILNVWIVTDSERVRVWLADIASELQNNQFDNVRKRISPDHSERVERTAQRMQSVKFSIAKVTRIHSIAIDYRASVPTALVRMNAFVEAESGGVSGRIPRWVGLALEKRGTEWLITDYEDREAQHEFINSSSGLDDFGPGITGGR